MGALFNECNKLLVKRCNERQLVVEKVKRILNKTILRLRSIDVRHDPFKGKNLKLETRKKLKIQMSNHTAKF